MTPASSLPLTTLAAGSSGITAAWGASLAEAASVCLEAQGHASPKDMEVKGAIEQMCAVSWSPIDDQTRRCWNDLAEAVEHGAYGIAALLVAHHTPYEVVERSRKGTGFDYWLGQKGGDDVLFQHTARLEVSGIMRGDSSAISSRVKRKLKQTESSDGSLPAYVMVVEYGTPLVQVADK